MATAAKELDSLYPWHVMQCKNKFCVFASAAFGSRRIKLSFFNNPPLVGYGDVPDSYRPGHGLIIKLAPYRHVDFVTDICQVENAYYEWHCQEAEFKILCNCDDPHPHDWMFSLFCAKYHSCIEKFMF